MRNVRNIIRLRIVLQFLKGSHLRIENCTEFQIEKPILTLYLSFLDQSRMEKAFKFMPFLNLRKV